MSRIISLRRRRPNLVDLYVPRESGVASWEFSASTSFYDSSPTLLQAMNYNGFKSASVPLAAMGPDFTAYKDKVRFVFDPEDYDPTLDDTTPFWLYLTTKDGAGSVVTSYAPHLILPYASTPNRAYNITGSIPDTATYEIQLPGLTANQSVQVDGTAFVTVAFGENEDGFKVFGTDSGLDFSGTWQEFTQMFITASAGSTDVWMSFRLVNSLSL